MNKTLQLLRIASLILADDRTITPEVAKEMFLQYKKEHPGTDFINEYNWAESQGLVIQDVDTKTTQIDDVASDTADKVQVELLDKQYMNAINEAKQSSNWDMVQKLVEDFAKKTGYDVKAYHGTQQDFTVFDLNRVGQGSGDKGYFGTGFYFTPIEGLAGYYGKNIVPAYLSFKKPYHTTSREKITDDLGVSKPSEIRNLLMEKGHDGVIVDHRPGVNSTVPFVEAVVFNPIQIKSAEPVVYDDEGNVIPLSQRFNQKNDDIRY